MPKGISRHLVRFARAGDRVVAVKETSDALAASEFALLRELRKRNIACVKPLAAVTGRRDARGEELPAALVTRHLKFSLPYRAVFSRTLRADTATRLIDALAALLVRLHAAGFFWGDVSLSNVLFRRDAGAFAAYLVDAETARFEAGGLSEGQREHDLEIARVNIAGELLDLEAAGRIENTLDPVEVAVGIADSYRALWAQLHANWEFPVGERWRLDERVRQLNDLGFDIESLRIRSVGGEERVRVRAKVVDAGHHQRRLLRLTGIDAEENQARSLLNNLDEYRASVAPESSEQHAAHEWLRRVFEPVMRTIPPELRRKLDAAEVFHQLLEHRWFLSERAGTSVALAEAVSSYIENVLRHRRDEEALLNPATGAITSVLSVISPATGAIPTAANDEEVEADWRDRV